MKVGKTEFNTEAIKKMSYKKFESIYKNILVGRDLKKVFKQLGGKLKEETSKEDDK